MIAFYKVHSDARYIYIQDIYIYLCILFIKCDRLKGMQKGNNLLY